MSKQNNSANSDTDHADHTTGHSDHAGNHIEPVLSTTEKPKRRRKKQPSKARGWRKPPTRNGHSPKNSHTSARKIARRKRVNDALAYREAGASFPEIAKEMKIAVSTAFEYVAEGLAAIPLENARAVLAQELGRLDKLLSAPIHHATAGDVTSTRIVLDIMHHRARLLGLW
jgi:hypothetical protein